MLGEACPGGDGEACRFLSETAGDKAEDWQLKNNQYFVIGWRCEKIKK